MSLFSRALLAALCFAFFSHAAFAEDYYWSIGDSRKFPSPSAACTAFMQQTVDEVSSTYADSNAEGSVISLVRSNEIRFDCNIKVVYYTRYERLGSVPVVRYGDSCSGEYNSETDECEVAEPDQCADKEGQTQNVSRTGKRGDGYYDTVSYNGKNYGSYPPNGCYGGCEAIVKNKCIFTLSSDTYICAGEAYFTGASCNASPQTTLESSPDSETREPEVIEEKEPCVYVQDGEGRKVCVSKESVEREGQTCGTVDVGNGPETRCANTVADSEKTEINTEVKESTDSSGNKTVVKTDVATNTKCDGNNQNCTTTTTTTTTTTKSDGSGTTTSSKTTCSGANCSGSGSGGSGSGSGSGDCTGDDCGDDDITTPELDDSVPGFGEATTQFMDRVSGSPILSSVEGIGLSGNGSCNMSSTNTSIGTVSADSMCDNSHWLDPLYFVFLAMHAFAAVRVFMSA